MKCPRCKNILEEPREDPDGLPGVKYRECLSCGYRQAVTRRQGKERLNPPLALFMGNPPSMRVRVKDDALSGSRVVTKGVISNEAHAISYRHADNGQLYKHDFETPVSLIAAEMGGKRVVIIVGSNDDIWDDYPDER